MSLVEVVYKRTLQFPKSEVFCLTSQIRKSAISIPSNIAEGNARKSRAEFKRFLLIAFGSGAELETQIEIGFRLHYLSETNYYEIKNLLDEVMKMLNKLVFINTI